MDKKLDPTSLTKLSFEVEGMVIVSDFEPRPEIIKICHAQLRMKFQLLIKGKMVNNKNFACLNTLRCCIYPANKCIKKL